MFKPVVDIEEVIAELLLAFIKLLTCCTDGWFCRCDERDVVCAKEEEAADADEDVTFEFMDK